MAKTCDSGVACWSDLNHDILSLVMMQLGVVDFLAFSGVCKPWRSLALFKRDKFLDSRPPISLYISPKSNEKDYHFTLHEFDGRRYKTIIPHSAGRILVRYTRMYLIFFGRKTNDIWLVDPIRRHELHFPNIPFSVSRNPKRIMASIFFSPSLSGWVFVMTHDFTNIWFSLAGQGTWNHVSSEFSIFDLLVVKEKIYTRNNVGHLFELRLEPEPKLMLLEIKNFPNFSVLQQLISFHESLYLREYLSENSYNFYKLDFEEMNWVLCEKTQKEIASIDSKLKNSDAFIHATDKLYIGSIWNIP